MAGRVRSVAGVGGLVERVLVIKLSALGDFVQATGCMKAIRRAHPDAELTLLTTAPFAALGRASGWFDRVWDDGRPAWGDLPRSLGLIARLRAARFDRVYDLQTQGRTNQYFRLLWPNRPAWSGNARGAVFEDKSPDRERTHLQDLQRRQLAIAGVADVPPPDVSWLADDVSAVRPAGPYALLVPGGAPHRPAKRWPAERFAELARRLSAGGISPVVLGRGDEESALASEIVSAEPHALDLVGRTSLGGVAELSRGATLAVGNDTGPLHLIVAAGCPAAALFSADSDPAMSAPRAVRPGQTVAILRRDDLADLPAEDVWAAVQDLRAPTAVRAAAAGGRP